MDLAVATCAAAFLGGASACGWGWGVLRRYRLLWDPPGPALGSLPMGRVALFGRAQDKAELLAPFSHNPCVYYRYRIERVRNRGRGDQRVRVRGGDSSAWGFYLEDATGRILVMPEGAELELGRDLHFTSRDLPTGVPLPLDPAAPPPRRGGAGSRPRLSPEETGELCFSEWRLEAGDPVYVLGVARRRPRSASLRRQRILHKLRALRSDPEAMAHFGTDEEGTTAAREWDVARNLAGGSAAPETEVAEVAVAGDPARRAPFRISDRSERELLRRYRWRAPVAFFGGAALAASSLIYYGLLRWGPAGGAGY